MSQLNSQLGNATRYFKAVGVNDCNDDTNVISGTYSVAMGAGAVVVRDNVAKAGGREISALAAGTEDTDAVNLKQLTDTVLVDGSGNALNAAVYDAGSNNSSVTFAGTNGSVLNNVANGTIAAGSMQAARLRRYATTCKVRSPISTIALAKLKTTVAALVCLIHTSFRVATQTVRR